MSLQADHYAGDRSRERSRGSRERVDPEYGRLNREDDFGARGRAARSPRRRRSLSPPGGGIDRYVPGSPNRPRRSRSPPRFDRTLERPQPGGSRIDRYVPGQGGTVPKPALQDPYKVEYAFTFSYFSEWYHQQHDKDGVPITKEIVQEAYDAYREDHQARTSRNFVSAHKSEEWFKERYVDGQKEITKQKVVAFRAQQYTKWKSTLESGGFDEVDREAKSEGVEEDITRGPDDGGLQPVLLIKTISPSVSRVQIEELASSNLDNFQFVSLSDPNPMKKFHRIGFILLQPSDPEDPLSAPSTVDESVVDKLNGKSISNDSHGDFICHVGIHNGPSTQKARKYLNEYMSMPKNLQKELGFVERAVFRLEGELRGVDEMDMDQYGGWEMIKERVDVWGRGEREARETSEEEGEEDSENEVELKILKKKIDMGIEYLRRVFNFCMYCVSSSDSIHELTRKCPAGHVRRPTPSPDFTADQKTINWTNNWWEKLEFFVNPPQENEEDFAQRLKKVGGKPVDTAVEEEVIKYVKQEDEGKYRCRVAACTKLFKGEEFWRKHLDKKHAEWLEGIRTDAVLVNAYVSDPTRVHPPRIEQNAQGNFVGSSGGRNNQMVPLPFGTMPTGNFPSNFAFNPALMQAMAATLPTGNTMNQGGVGPIRHRRESRGPPGERYGPYQRNNRGEREREREKRDREMRDAVGGRVRPVPIAAAAGGPEADLAVLGRRMKSYNDLDATEAKKSVDELDY